MNGNPNRWRSALVLVIIAMVVAQGLIATIRPLLPWLVLGLALLLIIGIGVAVYLRRTNRW